MHKVKPYLVILLAAAVFVAGILPVFANTINEKQSELNELNRDIREAQQARQQLKREETNILRDIRLLGTDINKVEAELRLLSRKISDTEGEIGVAEAELADAEARIDDMDKLLAVRLRAIYENGQVSYLDVLFNSSTFTDFLTRYNDLQLIIEEDRVLLSEFQAERELIVGMKDALEGRRRELLALRKENVSKQQELETKKRQRTILLASVQDEIDAQEDAIKKLEAEAKQVEKIIKDLQAAQRRANGYVGTGEYTWPVDEFGPSWITSGYGIRRHPITGKAGTFHGGVDIGIPHNRWAGSRSYIGTPVNVLAADSGVAYTYRMGSGYGNLVIVDHGGGVATVYAHNHTFLVGNDTSVQKGQAIATVGSTGYSTGPHLHFEVRINGERVNPLPYIQ